MAVGQNCRVVRLSVTAPSIAATAARSFRFSMRSTSRPISIAFSSRFRRVLRRTMTTGLRLQSVTQASQNLSSKLRGRWLVGLISWWCHCG